MQVQLLTEYLIEGKKNKTNYGKAFNRYVFEDFFASIKHMLSAKVINVRVSCMKYKCVQSVLLYLRTEMASYEHNNQSDHDHIVCSTLFFIYKNVVFPAQAEYSYFSADFRLKIFLYYS